MASIPIPLALWDVYASDRLAVRPDGLLVNPPINAEFSTYNEGSVYITGKTFDIILENRHGIPALVIWNRSDDSGDPDMVFYLTGTGSSDNYVEVNAPPEEE